MKQIVLEESPLIPPSTVNEAWLSVLRDPTQFVRHWNYKGAILSGVLRAPIFLITYLISRESIKLAIAAATVQFIFRFAFAGLSGALIQSFRRVEPPWKALASILLVVPVISHLFEYIVQIGFVYVTSSTDHTNQAILRSICVSLISTLFALFIMRRNVMIVGEAESKSLWSDVIHIPFLIYEFVLFIPNEIATLLRGRAFISTGLSFLLFGVFSELIIWGVTNKLYWTYGNGKMIEGLRFWGVDGMIILALAIIYSFVVSPKFDASGASKPSAETE